jgi:hypothetical protein
MKIANFVIYFDGDETDPVIEAEMHFDTEEGRAETVMGIVGILTSSARDVRAVDSDTGEVMIDTLAEREHVIPTFFGQEPNEEIH